jgi:Phage replication protein CRI
MLDTIKLGVPLTRIQHEKIKRLAEENDCWQWVLLNPSSGELKFRRTKGISATDGESFHRELRWDIPCDYIKNECRLTLEFSIPKYWYGHNIHLLYDFITPLNHLKKRLNEQFGFKARGQLIDVDKWHVTRVDVCYAWRFPSQNLAKQFLNSLKRLHFPRKKPIIYDDSILFSGKTYSFKVYLKAPEFKAHDRKELLKAKASLEWVNHCEALADGIVRVEATLRRQYLKLHNINIVSDLARPVHYVEWVEGTPPATEMGREFTIALATWLHFNPDLEGESLFSWLAGDASPLSEQAAKTLYSELTVPVRGFKLNDLAPAQYVEIARTALGIDEITPGVIAFKNRDNPTAIIQFLLAKFVGENAGMQRADEVESKLMESYKPVKAARLVAFWLYVQKFGSAKAKEVFQRDSYYRSVREMKKAGVTKIL